MAGPEAGARAGGGRGRRRPGRARLSVLRPARRRAGDPPGGRARARAGHAHGRLPRGPRRARARSLPETPLVPMTYASLLEAYGWERFDADARAAGATSLIVADLPAGDRPDCGACSSSRRLRPTSGSGSRPNRPTAGSTSSRLQARPARASDLSPALAGLVERAPGHVAPAVRRLRHLDPGAGARRRRARGRDRGRPPPWPPSRARQRCATTSPPSGRAGRSDDGLFVDARNVLRSRWPNLAEDEFVGLAEAWGERHGAELCSSSTGTRPQARSALTARERTTGPGGESADDWLIRDAPSVSGRLARHLRPRAARRGGKERCANRRRRLLSARSGRLSTLQTGMRHA